MRTRWSTMIKYYTIVQLRYYWNELRILFSKELVIVYTMAKVGSSSVFYSIKEHFNSSVIHIHNLDLKLEKENRKLLRTKRLFPDSIPNIKSIHKHIKKNKKCKIISIVRDPVSRNVSAFFEAIEFYTNGKLDQLSNEELQEIYNTKMYHTYPLTWFDDQVKSVLNIDVYKIPFDTRKKYTVIEQHNIKLLVLRSDLKDQVKLELINDFLSSNINALKLKNIGAKKYYNTRYLNFKNNKFLEKKYLSSMLSSKFAKHFYSKAELKEVFDHWFNHK